MQGYLKLKEVDEELYEVDLGSKEDKAVTKINLCKNIQQFFYNIFFFLVVKIKKWFNIITVKEIYSGLIFILPISKYDNEEILENNEGKIEKDLKQHIGERHLQKKLQRCIPKVKKLMKKYQISSLILSEDLRKNETFMQNFFTEDMIEKKVHILDGKGLMPYLIKEILEYILQKQGKNIELEDLYILVKNENIDYKENIAFLAQYFKTINIVTPCLKGYQKLGNQLEEKYNVMLTVTNNRKKSLRKAKWIVNFDVEAEEMKKYTIYRSSAIIYLEKEGIYKGNAFDGIHICQAGIDVSQEVKDFFIKQHLLNQYPITILYEGIITKMGSFLRIKEQMKKDKVRITKIYGSRGELVEEEYKKLENTNKAS